jgi:hypothetical protein
VTAAPTQEQLNKELRDENYRLRAAFRAIGQNVGTRTILIDYIHTISNGPDGVRHTDQFVACFPDGDEMAALKAVVDLLRKYDLIPHESARELEPRGTARDAAPARAPAANILAWLEDATDEEISEVNGWMNQNVCRHCGGDAGCQCWNDE